MYTYTPDIMESIRLAEAMAESEYRLKFFIKNFQGGNSVIEAEKDILTQKTEKVHRDINATMFLPQARLVVQHRHLASEDLDSCFIGKLDLALVSLRAKAKDNGYDDDDIFLDLALLSDDDKLTKLYEVVEEGDKNKIVSVFSSLLLNAKLEIKNKMCEFEYDLSVLDSNKNLPS